VANAGDEVTSRLETCSTGAWLAPGKNETAAAFQRETRGGSLFSGWRDLRKPAVEMRLVFVFGL
jgi:hypothetical protein